MKQPPVPWLRLLAEGTAIVVSILLAFGIDALWDGLQRQDEAEELLVGLHIETVQNLTTLRAGLDSLSGNHDRLGRFVRSAPPDYSTELGDSAWSAVVRPQYRDYSVTLSYGFLDATIGAGKLGLIQDTELRAALAGLHALQGIADESLGPLVALGTEATVILMEYPEIQRGIASPGFVLSVPSAPLLRALRSDPRLVSLAGSRIMFTVGYIAGLRALEENLVEVVSMLEAAHPGIT